MARYRGVLMFFAGFAAALAIGWVGFPYALYERIEQPLQFNHRVHTEDAGMACADCHAFADDGRFAGIPATASCAMCHVAPLGESEAERVLVEEYLEPGREIEWLVYSRQPVNVYFPHAQHVNGAGLDCETCHGPHGASESLRPFERNRLSGYSRDVWGSRLSRVGMSEWEGAKMVDCSRCHRDLGVTESCLTCHK
jgi:menaquinone reductase, multiheme cytochrome c subunit